MNKQVQMLASEARFREATPLTRALTRLSATACHVTFSPLAQPGVSAQRGRSAPAPIRADLCSRSDLRIAIASSGLGHVHRGVETWARDLATALHNRGVDVRLFQGAGRPEVDWAQALRCRLRFDPSSAAIVERFRGLGGWRYGIGSVYQLEQTTFAIPLWRAIRRDFDILHVQDPWLALILHRLHRLGLSRPRVILAHGTEEPPEFLARFANLQHLAPCYNADWSARRPARQLACAVPNFVDTNRFRPGCRRAARAAFDLDPDAFVVLSAAAIKRGHKRIDALVEEFRRFLEISGRNAILVIAGSREADTADLIAGAERLLGERVRFLVGVDRGRMPDLFRAADIFALASLHEMMPIAVLEALASGLPVACSDTPALRWMVGPAGHLTSIDSPGALAVQLSVLSDDKRRSELSAAARDHAVATFSEAAVLPAYLDLYARVAGRNR
jgi:glycosyltransferase involved in cell wall biosynthesis